MEVEFTVEYHPEVVGHDIPKLPPAWKAKIQSAIEEKLMCLPHIYGKPLRRSLKGYRRLRVADYRVVFRISGNMVIVVAVLHRSVVYALMGKRI